MSDAKGNLKIEGITKQVGSESAPKVVLQDCTFEVEPGKFTVVIGPSACGKTTLINLIAGYELPNRGAITLDGAEIRAPGPDRLLVFQETALFPWMTALENVMYGPSVRGELEKPKIRQLALDLLKTVGLAQFAEKYPMQLSGGMQRRCELARALINNPTLLLMDEPFRGLDHMTRELMQEYLLTLLEERGGTIVFVASEIDEAIFLGDQIIVLGSSPARVKSIIDVNLPRPRVRRNILVSPRYAELKQRTLALLHEEAAGAFHRSRSKGASSASHAMTRGSTALVAAITVAVLALDTGAASSREKAAKRLEVSRPIIAEVVSRPSGFLGRRVEIYGLVVEARDGGRRFLLQDVSQRPLLVIAPPGQRVAEGSQLLVSGTLRRVHGRLELSGHDLTPVQVVAGGGCC